MKSQLESGVALDMKTLFDQEILQHLGCKQGKKLQVREVKTQTAAKFSRGNCLSKATGSLEARVGLL